MHEGVFHNLRVTSIPSINFFPDSFKTVFKFFNKSVNIILNKILLVIRVEVSLKLLHRRLIIDVLLSKSP